MLAVKSEQGVFWGKLVYREIPTEGGEARAEFRSVQPIASVPETAEPLVTMGLRHCCACPDHLPTLAASVARGTHVIQPAKGQGEGRRSGVRHVAELLHVCHQCL